MTTRVFALLVVLVGCVSDPANEPDLGELELDLTGNIAPPPIDNSKCGWSGGQYYCRDVYTGKWCTGSSQLTVDWDYVADACTWNGYATSSSYCYNGSCAYCWYGTPARPAGWFYWLAHHHCD